MPENNFQTGYQADTSQAGQVVPTQTFSQPDTAVANPDYIGNMVAAEQMLRKVGSVEDTLDSANNFAINQPKALHLFGRSVGRVFAIAGVLLVIIFGVAAAAVLHGTKDNPGNNSDGQSLLAGLSGAAKGKNSQQNEVNNSILSINNDTVITQSKSFTTTGNVLIQSTINSAEAFKIQNSAGSNILVADTKNNQVNIGNKPPGDVSLNVSGDITTNGALVSTAGYSLSSQGLTIGNLLVCTARGCISSSSPAPTPTSPTIDVANLDYLNVAQSFSAAKGLKLDSTKAFQVQNAAGTNNVFVVDSTDGVVGIGMAPINGLAALQVAGSVNASNGFETNGVAGTNFTCPAGELLQQAVISGGLVTSGSCVTIAGGTTPSLQQVYDSSFPAHIGLSNASGVLSVQDAASPLASNLFEVTSNGGVTKYFAVNSLGISVTGNVTTTGQYQVNGSQISSANLSNDASLAKLGANQTFSGNNTFSSASNSFTGSGSGLTSLNASNVSSGTLNDSHLSANVALLNANQTFTANNTFKAGANSITAFQVQNAAGTDNLLIADTVNNRVGVGKAPTQGALDVNGAIYQSGNQVCDSSGNCVGSGAAGSGVGGSGSTNTIALFTGVGTIGNSLLTQSGSTVTDTGNFSVTSQYQVSGLQISSANLSNDSNLAKLNGNQTFSGNNTFSSASNSFTGNGAGLTSLNASNVSSGTLNDARLSANVALLNANNTFTGNNSIHLNSTAFTIQDAVSPLGADLFEVTNNAGTTKYFSVSTTGAKIGANDVCTTAGNCAGAGGGVTTAGGTTNKLAKFTAGSAIGDSIITDNGSTVTIGGTLAVNTISPTAAMTIGVTGQGLTLQGDGTTKLSATTGGVTNSIVFAAPGSGNKTITVPNASGTIAVSASGPLALDAAGSLTCPTCLTSGGGGGSAGVSSVNTLTGALTLQGTSNQISVSSGGTTVTLSTPQDIATTSSPAFANVNVTGQYKVSGSQISSANLSNDANLAKLDGTQTFTGVNTFKNTSNSAAALQIQNAAGTSNLFIADTTHTRLAVAQATANYTLDVGGDINTTGVYRINGSQIASSNLLDASNIALLSANQTFSGNNTFSSASNSFTGNGSGLTNLDAGNVATGTLNDARLSANVALLNAHNNFKNTADSTSSFQIQNSAGTSNLFVADTTHTRLAIAQATASYTLDVAGDINTTTGFRVGGTPGSSTTCSGGNVLQNAVVSGGIITGGSCVANGGGTTPTFATVYTSGATSADETATLTSSRGGIIIQDNVSPIGASLFTVQSNGGTSKFLDVSATGVAVAGSLDITGNYKVGGTQISSANLSNDSNLAKLSANQTFSGNNSFSGTVLAQNTSNSGTAFQIQNNTGTSNLFIADTSNSRIGIDKAPTQGALDVNGGIYQSGNQVCDISGNCAGTGTGGIGGGGTAGTIAVFTGTGFTIGNSILTQASGTATLAGNLIVNSGDYVSLVGGNTASRPGSPTEGMLYYDTTTKSLLVYSNAKWQADRSSSTKIVSMGSPAGCTGSTPVASLNADTADYVVNSCTSAQTTINTAITALGAQGGTVYLEEGTYIVDGAINLASNVTLAGSGTGTILKLKDGINAGINLISISSLTRVGIRDLKLDGNQTNNSSGSQRGINATNLGSGSGTTAVTGIKVSNISADNFRNDGVFFGNVTVNSSITTSAFVNNGATGVSFNGGTPANNVISGNKFQGNVLHGLSLISGVDNLISDNNADTNGGDGISVTGAGNIGNTITGNTASNSSGAGATGIVINGGSGYTVSSNVMNGNSYGMQVNASNSTISGNTITANNNNAGILLTAGTGINITSNTISANTGTVGGIWINSATDSTITGNTIMGNTTGILDGSDRNTITGNTINASTGKGVYLNGANSSVVSGNMIKGNGTNGIAIDGNGANNQITGNRIFDNGGVGASDSIGLITSGGAGNSIIGNQITDTAGTGFAIKIGVASFTNTYLSNNTFSGTGATAISDSGTGTIYANQVNANGDFVLDAQRGLAVGTLTASSSLSLQGGETITSLPAVAQPTVTPTLGTATNWSYKVTALDGLGETVGSTAGTTAAGAATLDVTHFNTITWTPVGGAINYKVYRTTAGGTPVSTGLIGTVSSNVTSFVDNGIVATTAVPTANTSGGIVVQNALGGSLLYTDTANSNVTVGQGDLLVTGLGIPALPVITAGSNQGGTLLGDSTTYYYKITALNSAGNETLASPEASIAGSSFTKLAVPTALTAAANATAGSVSCNNTAGQGCKYEVTFVTANGETTVGAASTSVLNVTSKQIDLSNIPLGPTGTTARKIYRSTNNGAYLLDLTINNNTTTATTENVAAPAGAVPGSNTATTNLNNATVTFTPITGATGYRVYRGTTAGSETAYQSTASSPFTDTGAAGTTASTPTASSVERVGIGTAAPTTNLDVRGNALFKNGVNTTSAFNIQDASGASALNVDTADRFVGINNLNPGATLDVLASSPNFFDGFETGALSPFTTDGVWAVTGHANTGNYSVSESTWLQNLYLKRTLSAPGNISFWMATQKGSFDEPINFSTDGVVKLTVTANNAALGIYHFYSVAVPAGVHTFSWSVGTDCCTAPIVWVDDVTVTNSGAGTAALFNGGNVGIGTAFPNATLEADGTTLIKAAAAGDSNNLFQVQNSVGNDVLNVGTVSQSNLIVNSSFESSTTGWAKLQGAETTFATTTNGTQDATQALQVTTDGTNANQGAKYPYNFKPNTTYDFSVYASVASGSIATFDIGTSINGSVTTCLASQTLTTTVTRFSCSFTTGATVTASDYLFVRRSTAAIATIYLDAAQLEYATSPSTYRPDVYPNLISNPDFENSTDGWAAKQTATISSSDDFSLYGNRSLKIVTGTSSDNGALYQYPFTPNGRYSLSFWARRDTSSAATFNIGRQENGSNNDCLTGQTINTTWTNFTCTFTVGGTVNGTSYLYIKQTDTVSDNIYVDGVTLVASGVAQTYASPGISLDTQPLYGNITLNSGNIGEIQPWQRGTALPGLRHVAASVTANGYVYDIGGTSGSYQSTVLYAKLNADGSLGAWNTATNLLPAVRGNETAVVANGYVYVIGGSTNGTTFQSTVYYAKLNADGSVGVWQTNANALPDVRGANTSLVANGYVYVIGGENNSVNASTVYYAKLNADGSTGAWQTNAYGIGCATPGCGSPVAIRAQSSVVANGYVYVIGGFTSSSVSTVYYAKLNADGSVGAWSTATNSLPDVRDSQTSVVANGYVYAIAGETSGTSVSTVYYAKLNADGSVGTWTSSANSVPHIIRGHTTVMANGYIYAMGGNDGGSFQSGVYYTSTARVLVGGSLDLVGLSGQNYSDSGGTGGTLTAGNTTIVGTLDVRDQANFSNNVGINGTLNVTGNETIKAVQNATNILQVQNGSGVNVLNINTVNLIANSDFETGTGAAGQMPDGWAVKGASTVTVDNTQALFGSDSMKVVTTTAANDGAVYNYQFLPSTQYTLSLYAKVSAGSITDFVVGDQNVGSDINCLTAQTLTTSWTRFSCTFTTGATINTSNIYVQKSGASAETFYVDGVQLEQAASASTYREGDLNINGNVTVKNSNDSLTAFQVQNSIGTSVLSVDTYDRYIGINNSAPNATLDLNASSIGYTNGFESGVLAPFTTSNSGQGTPATVSNSSPHNGVNSAFMGTWTSTGGGQIDMQLTKTLSSAGTVTFWCKGNLLTGNGDSSSFLIDGTTQNTNGCFTGTYTQLSFAVGSGAHTFDWRVISGFWQTASMYVDDVQVTNTGNAIAALFNGGTVGIGTAAPSATLEVDGSALFKSATNSASSFQVQDASAASLFNIDTTARGAGGGNLIKIGNSTGTDTATTILQLDSTTADPTTNLAALNGGVYYNSTTNKVSVVENGVAKALCNTTDKGCAATSFTKVVAMGSPAGCTGTVPVASLDTNADYVVNSCTSAQTTINTAITALGTTGGTVYLKEGTYILDGTINLANNVTLAGSGQGTVLKLKDSINAGINMITGSSISKIGVRDLKMDGNRTNNSAGTQHGMSLSVIGSGTGTSAVPGININNVTIQNFRTTGIDTSGITNSTITNTNIINDGGNGISFNFTGASPNATYLRIDNNTIQGSGGYGIFGDITGNPSYSTFNNNVIESNTNSGLYISGSNNTFSGNMIKLNGGQGIDVEGSNNTVSSNNFMSNTGNGIYIRGNGDSIAGNTSTSNGGWGIGIDDASAGLNSVSGNRLNSNTSGGIYLGGGNNNSANGNTVTSNSGNGIQTTGSKGSITGNTVSSNTGHGIYVGCCNDNYNVVSSNEVSSNSGIGIVVDGSDQTQITNNKLYDNGGSGSSSSILVFANAFHTPNNNQITNNVITDTAGTGYAIELSGGLKPTNTYISGNLYSGTGATAIQDAGTTGTTYVNQVNGSGDIILNNQGSGLTVGAMTASATLSLQGGIKTVALTTPAQPGSVTPILGSATTWGYKVTALDGLGETAGSTEKTTTTGAATLDSTHFNTIVWTPVGGAINYKIYRTTAGGTPSSTGLIGTVVGNVLSFVDNGIAATTAVPTTNTSGGINVTGTALFKPTTDSTTAFQIQDASSVTLLAVDTTNRIITISGDTTTFAKLTITNAHFKSSQTTAPTIGTPANCGSSPTASVVANSTDSAGSFTITAGTAGGYTTCDTVFTFNKAYGAAPKSVIITPTTAVGSATGAKPAQVTATSSTTFTVKLTSPPLGDSEVNAYYYWVIE